MSITPPNERPRRDDLSAPSAEPLTERERRYRTLFGAMDEGFCVIEMSFDDAGRPVDYDFLEFNDAFERLTGITAEAALAGRSARELFPTLEEHWFETYGRVATTGEPARFENRAEAMGKWFEVHAFRIGGDGSREVGILFKDSTRRRLDDLERERLLAEAREREAFLHLITDRLPVRVGYLDLDYRYRFVNGAYERAFGLSPGGGVGLTVAEMAGEEAFRMAKPFLDCALAGDTHTQELTVPYAFGERSVEVQYVADRDEAGEVSGLVIHVLDVTERKRIETERERLISELEIERGKLQTLFELAPAFIAVLRGRDLVFEYVNDAYYGIVGHRPVVGLPLAEAIPEAVGGRTGQDYDRLLLDIMDTGETRTFSERPVTLQRVPDGPLEERFLDLSYQPLREADGSVSGVLVHGIDVTKGVLARREVRAAYDLLAGITESTQELIVSLDRDYCFTSLNEAYRRDFKGVFGVDPQIGQSLLDALSHLPQELANAKALWARALAGESVDLTAEFGDPGLARKVFDLRFYPIRNGVGEIVGAGEIARNVTERERLVSELAVARERLESLFMMSPSAIAVLRGEDFRFEFANAAYLMMFRRQEVAGRTVAEVFPEAEEQGFLDLLRGVMTTGTPFHHPETAFAMRATADEPARVVYVDFLYQAIREADGTVSGIFAHIVDVTSQVEARQAISQREELFRTVFEQAPDDAIVVMDADRTVTAWNPAAERITGWSASEALGQLGDLIFTAEDRRAGAPEAEAAEAMRRGKAEDERWHVRKNGSRFWGSGTMNALHDGEGGVRGYLKVFRDATERYEETQTLAFLSLLTEAVIEERDAERILETVERMLGQYLGASRVTYGEFAADEESFTVRSEWGPDVVSVLGNHTLSSYGQDAVETLRSGRNLVVRDTAKDLDPALFPQTELIQARSGVTVPVVKDGRLVALCVVHDRVPREWTDDEIGLVQQVADRMSSEIERVRAEEALRRSEERFRQLVDLSPSTVWFGEPDGGLSYIS